MSGKPRLERFNAKVQRTADGHWLWIGAKDGPGYGRFAWDATRANKKVISAARASLLLFRNIASDQEPDHQCQYRHCVNPDCLESVTHQENVRRSNGFAGIHARMTHCKRGHEFTPENARLWRGQRHCRACGVIRLQAHMARRNGTAPAEWQGWLGGC